MVREQAPRHACDVRSISERARTGVAAFVAAGVFFAAFVAAGVFAIPVVVAMSAPAKVPLLGTHNTGIDSGGQVVTWGSSVACPAGNECDEEHPAVTAAP